MRTLQTVDPLEAAEFIKRGGVVAFPTETVYGLGANVFDEAAVAKVFAAKQRPADNPLIAHVSSVNDIGKLAAEVTGDARALIKAYFPGPLTIVLRKTPAVPSIATAGLDTIGIRMPANALAHQFISACGVPLVAPSANLSGRPSPTTWNAVFEDLDGRIDCILQGEATDIGIESSVVDCTGDVPVLLRLGAVSLADLRAVVSSATDIRDQTLESRSPGLRHKHYTPRAQVIVGFEDGGSGNTAFIGLSEPAGRFTIVRHCASVAEYAHSLFEFFRECDRRDIATIYCEGVEETGLGAALMDRIRRAAEK